MSVLRRWRRFGSFSDRAAYQPFIGKCIVNKWLCNWPQPARLEVSFPENAPLQPFLTPWLNILTCRYPGCSSAGRMR
ncbi:hypothetical protein M2407_005194 [Serratia sp. BIGb0234]|nr:hypothetical protein [Serratia sp. BIGb0234]